MNKKLATFTNGFIKENPLLILNIGLCSSLGVTVSIFNGFGMGLSMTFVLVMSEIVISLFRKNIPSSIRLPIFIIIIAAFTTIVQMLLQAYVDSLYSALGVFLPLIVVNCIILGRAEAFANKNTVIDSALDGIGMGLGFTLALALMGTIRELLSAGTLLGFTVFSESWFTPIQFFGLAPGGFFVFGFLIAMLNLATKGKALKKQSFSCGGCPMYNSCNLAEANEEVAAAPVAAQKGAEA